VGIELKRGHRVGVTQDGLNSFYVATDGDQICRKRVSEIVHSELHLLSLFQHPCFRDILRDEELPRENPDQYLAKMIRWTMQSWPKRGELRFGSQNFARRFKEIQADFALATSGAESSCKPADDNEEF
jgi:hypothetical protein